MRRDYPTALDLVGNTPLVRLQRLGRQEGPLLLAKLEYLNPGGSVKDRIALRMIERAEEEGKLAPGGTIVEPTSGNTGVGLAIAAARKGYRCIFVMPDKIAQEKISLLRAFGAEVVICPTAVPPPSPESYYSVSARLAEEIPGAYKPDQYSNPANPQAHYETTGPEIWEQTEGEVDALVLTVGTGGTISGSARFLKERKPELLVVGADPEGSIYSSETVHPYLVEGIGEDFWPQTYDASVVDEYVTVSDRDSFVTARRLAREEGLLVGGSGGTAVWAMLEVAERFGPEATLVTLIPDGGRGYLSKFYDDNWLREYGIVDRHAPAPTIEEVLSFKRRAEEDVPPLIFVESHRKVGEAVDLMHRYGISQIPVIRHEPADSLADVIGSIQERGLLERVLRNPDTLNEEVAAAMDPPLRAVEMREPVDTVISDLEAGNTAVIVAAAGKPVGVLTRADFLEYLAHNGAGSHRAVDFETRAIHEGHEPDPATGSLTTPIYQTSTYVQEEVGKNKGYDYSRAGNPTRTALETCLASLESADHGVAFSSGLGGVTTLMHLVSPGERVISINDVYGGVYRMFSQIYEPKGYEFTFLSAQEIGESLTEHLDDDTRFVWLETPTNPLLNVVDIRAAAEAAHARGAIVVVDNTFATPYLQRPLELGADVVVHSTTKYLGGHSDVIGGFVATNDPTIAERLRFLQKSLGAVPGPFDCWLVLRGLKTLAVRMDRHSENARRLAAWLDEHDAVERVLYPGLSDHPGHEIAARQMSDFGGMISFLAASEEDAIRLVARTKVWKLAESLGGVESLIEQPARMTHASTADAPFAVPGNLVRLSVGIESVDDLLADLEQALSAVAPSTTS